MTSRHLYIIKANPVFIYPNLYQGEHLIVQLLNLSVSNLVKLQILATICYFLEEILDIHCSFKLSNNLFCQMSSVGILYFAAAPYGNYWVLDTDYEHYTLIYSCTSILGISHFEFGWILARTRTIPDATTQKLFGIMENYHINSHHFMKTDQTGC